MKKQKKNIADQLHDVLQDLNVCLEAFALELRAQYPFLVDAYGRQTMRAEEGRRDGV